MQDFKDEFINSQEVVDSRGRLDVFELGGLITESSRVFFTLQVPSQAQRGGRRVFGQDELIIVISGSVDVQIEVANNSFKTIHMNNASKALLIRSGRYRRLMNFSTNAIICHVCTNKYKDCRYEMLNDKIYHERV